MPRWEPDAEGRLQAAAVALFLERGYAQVTVAQIAERAALTKRTFFNHFADKREILFSGAQSFEANVARYLAEADAGLEATEAAVTALTRGGQELAGYVGFARLRRELISSSLELQERDLVKQASLASGIAEGLSRRGVAARTATLAAQVAVTVFTLAYEDWGDNPAADFGALMQQALADFRQAAGGRA